MTRKQRLLFWMSGITLVLAVLTGGAALAGREARPVADLDGGPISYAPWEIEIIDSGASGSDVGRYVSVSFSAETNKPYVSYYDATNQDLRLAYPYAGSSTPCSPASDWACETVDSTGDVGQYSSVDYYYHAGGLVTSRKIGIAYYDATNEALKVAIWSCSLLGGCGWDIATVDDPPIGTSGRYASFRFDSDGIAHVSYQHYHVLSPYPPSYSLMHAYYVGSGGNCGVGDASEKWQCDAVESLDGSGYYTSLVLTSDNRPAIAHYNYSADVLRLCPFSGNSWFCETIDALGGKYTSLALDGAEHPHIAYYGSDGSNDAVLRYAHYVGNGGNCGPFTTYQCDTIDEMGAGTGISLAIDPSGLPVIAYQDSSDNFAPSVLNIARPMEAYNITGGNCGPDLGLFRTWQCDTIDNATQGGGGGYLSEADYASVGVNSAGLVFIAYNENDDYNNLVRLKVASQYYPVFLPLVVR